MANYKAADSKREQFRRYLEKSGVMDTLTKVLVALYEEPEKPNCALEYPLLNSLANQHITGAEEFQKLKTGGCNHPMHAARSELGAVAPENPEVEALRLEVAEMKEKYEAVLEENKKLKAKLAQYEPPQEEKRGE